MAHSNGRIYIDTNTTPHKGVEIADLQQVLGRGVGDLGLLCSDQEWYDTGVLDGQGNPVYALRVVGRINPLARCKPMRVNKIGLLADADRQDAYFGLDITPSKGGTAAIGSLIARYASEWGYLPPRGATQGEWFRLRDFEEYNHNANSFINTSDMTLPSQTVVGQSATFRIGLNTGNNLRDGSISIQDLHLGGSEGTPFSELYGGLIFASGNSYKLLTSPYKLGETNQQYVAAYGTEITFPAPSATASYVVYPVLSRNKYLSLSDTGNTDDIVSLPLTPFTFKVVSEVSQESIAFISASAVIGAGRYTVRATVALGGTLYNSISSYTVYIKTASAYYDTGGTLVATINNTSPLVKGTPQTVAKTILGSIPEYVYLKVEDTARPAVYDERWVEVRWNEPDL